MILRLFSELRQRKVIPCTFQPCSIPHELRCYHVLSYHRIQNFHNFYDKLRDSINAVPSEKLSNGSVLSRINSELGRRSSDVTDNKTSAGVTASDGLGAKKHSVKFKSANDLHTPEKDSIVPETNIVPSTSAESLREDASGQKKTKTKKRWKIKISSNGKTDSKEQNIISKYKKLFWHKKIKEAS